MILYYPKLSVCKLAFVNKDVSYDIVSLYTVIWVRMKTVVCWSRDDHSTGMSHFMAGIHSWKTLCKSNTEFPFTTVYFLGVRGLKTSSYMTTPLVDIWTCRIYNYMFYVQYTYISIQYIYIYIYIYIFISNALKL